MYDDKILLAFSYQNGQETISLHDVNDSDLSNRRPPKLEIAAVKTAAISPLTTEIPQTDFCFDHLKGTPFSEGVPFIVYCPAKSEVVF